jgi:oxygen-dependent protoporphyrinogen oxidase
VGGVIASEQNDDRLVERGPNSMQLTDDVAALLGELALTGDVMPASPSARNRFIAKGGKLWPVPTSPRSFISTPLLSPRAKLRLLREPFVRRATVANESVASFIERRLGREPLAAFVAPFFQGVYAGDVRALSAELTMRRLVESERQHGSLAGGVVRAARAARRTRSAKPRHRHSSVSLRRGLGQLPTALATALGDRIQYNARVLSLADGPGGRCQVTVERPWGLVCEWADHVIVATPAHAIPDVGLRGARADHVASIRTTDHAPIATITIGVRRSAVLGDVAGFGFLATEAEPCTVLGVLFTSSMFPGRCPDDEHLFTCFVGGTRARENAALGTDALVARVMIDLRQLLGVRGDPTFVSHTRSPRAIPQYTIRHRGVLEGASAIEAACDGLTFAGSWRHGVSVGDCIRGGRLAAQRALQHVGRA